jgi:oxygen-dependent protoporphyrinogen oxidase
MAALLNEIPYATMTVVCFGYRRERISRDLDGFGYLIPKQEGKNILGTLWDSSIFENRAPDGHVLLRSMMGGACFPQYINLPDEEVQKRVQADLKTIMGISEPPDFVKIFRHEKAIPQYTVGHAKRLAGLEEQAKAHPGLILTGNSYRGIGLNDCVAAAQRASDEAIALLQNR